MVISGFFSFQIQDAEGNEISGAGLVILMDKISLLFLKLIEDEMFLT